MNNKKIYIKKDVIFGLLDYCKSLHPVEGILLLQGTHVKEKIEVDRLMIPPLPTHSEEFSSFDQYQLPLDSSILGTAHSHPNGVNEPSDTDLSNFFGLIMIIVTPPFVNENDIKVYNSKGNTIKFSLYE